jgi:hypothetical protein
MLKTVKISLTGKEKWANEKFKEINEALSVLGNPAKEGSTTSSEHWGMPVTFSVAITPEPVLRTG